MTKAKEIKAGIRLIRASYQHARKVLDQQERDQLAELQAQCVHEWEFNQVAGEGRYCKLCELYEPHADS